MPEDWNGNKKSTFTTLGASSHSKHDRAEHDYYATDPRCIDDLFSIGLSKDIPIWEPACGEGHLSRRMKEAGFTVRESDLVDRGIGAEVLDFLKTNETWDGDIVTNPPYNKSMEFVLKSLETTTNRGMVYMFLKLTFLEGQKRYDELFSKFPPASIHVYSARQKCAKNGDFENTGSSAACYAWFVWSKGFNGSPQIKWI